MGCGKSKEGQPVSQERAEEARLKKVPIVFVLGMPLAPELTCRWAGLWEGDTM